MKQFAIALSTAFCVMSVINYAITETEGRKDFSVDVSGCENFRDEPPSGSKQDLELYSLYKTQNRGYQKYYEGFK